MSTQTVIDDLVGDLKPVRRLWHPAARLAVWGALSIIYMAACIYFLGVRPDVSELFAHKTPLFDMALALAISLSAAVTSFWLCVPDMRGQHWMKSVTPLLVGVFVVWNLARSFEEGVHIPHLHWDHCFGDGILMATLPVFFISLLARRGKTVSPRLLAFNNIVCVAGAGYIGLRLTCVLDTVGHSTLLHLLPFVVGGAVLGVFAKKIFRW